MHVHTADLPSIYPAENQYVASSSMMNVTFNCSVPAGSDPVWGINGLQIRSSLLGVLISTEGQNSIISITQMARLRQGHERLSIQCLSTNRDSIKSLGTIEFLVVTFGRFGT